MGWGGSAPSNRCLLRANAEAPLTSLSPGPIPYLPHHGWQADGLTLMWSSCRDDRPGWGLGQLPVGTQGQSWPRRAARVGEVIYAVLIEAMEFCCIHTGLFSLI